MKIAISSSGDTLQSEIDLRFARCPYYIIYDTDRGSFEAVKNENPAAGGGAGVRASQQIADMGVKAIITGNIGPNAFRVLSSASIKIYSGASGIINDVIEKFINGVYKNYSNHDVGSHFGKDENN
jgi:predicted Fe-Mo cluster-binding NifX family protein